MVFECVLEPVENAAYGNIEWEYGARQCLEIGIAFLSFFYFRFFIRFYRDFYILVVEFVTEYEFSVFCRVLQWDVFVLDMKMIKFLTIAIASRRNNISLIFQENENCIM